MSFNYLYLAPVVGGILISFVLALVIRRVRFNLYLKKYFFLETTFLSHFGLFLFVISFLTMGVIPLKPEMIHPKSEIIKTSKISINLDVSGSMLTKSYNGDKSRLREALEFAEELIMNLPGNFEFSLNIFSHNLISITPFTSDKDYGQNVLHTIYDNKKEFIDMGTDLPNVISEYGQYKKEYGNIYGIFITDGGDSDFYPPEKIIKEKIRMVYFIGVGDLTPRPILDEGYRKRYRGKQIITKRNDRGINNLCRYYDDCQFYIARDFNLKTLIRDLKSDVHLNKEIVRMDLSKLFLFVGLILFSISNLFFILAPLYKTISIGLLVFFIMPAANAGLFIKEFKYLFNSNGIEKKIRYANSLYQKGEFRKSEILYKELDRYCQTCQYQKAIKLNYGTLMLVNGKEKEGVTFLNQFKNQIKNKEERSDFLYKISNNMLLILRKRDELKMNIEGHLSGHSIEIRGQQNLYLKPLADEKNLQSEMLARILKLNVKKQKNMGKNW